MASYNAVFAIPNAERWHHDLVCLRPGRFRQRFLTCNTHGECGFERIFHPQQRFVPRIPFIDCLRNGAEFRLALRLGYRY
jgi:hypothetical protein